MRAVESASEERTWRRSTRARRSRSTSGWSTSGRSICWWTRASMPTAPTSSAPRSAANSRRGRPPSTGPSRVERWCSGTQYYSRQELEKLRQAGQLLEVRVLGLATIANDVSPELALATIASVEVLGAFRAPAGGEDRTGVADGLTDRAAWSDHNRHPTSHIHTNGVDACRRPRNHDVPGGPHVLQQRWAEPGPRTHQERSATGSPGRVAGSGGGAAAGTTRPGHATGSYIPEIGGSTSRRTFSRSSTSGVRAAARHRSARHRPRTTARPPRLRSHSAVKFGISRTPPRPARGPTTSTSRRGTPAIRCRWS